MDEKLKEAIMLLEQAHEEIKNLRRANYEKSLRLQMHDDMMMIFKAEAPRSGCCDNSQDISYRVDKFIRSNKSEVKNG